MASSPITSWQIDGKTLETMTDCIFLDSKITADRDCSHEIKRCLLLGRKTMANLDSVLKNREITADKGPYSQRYGFSSSRVQIWELDHKEGWAPKNWFFRTVVLKKTLESPSDNKEIKLVNPKWNQPWIFAWRADAEAPILLPPDANSGLLGKDRDAGKDGRQEKKGVTEKEMVGWHRQLNGHGFQQTPGDSERCRSPVCCSPLGHKQTDTTESLSNTKA